MEYAQLLEKIEHMCYEVEMTRFYFSNKMLSLSLLLPR